MTAHTGVFNGLAVLRSRGQTEEALRALRSALRASDVAPEDFEQAGRFLVKHRQNRERDVRVHVLAQCTAAWFRNFLEAVGYARGTELCVTLGEFDTIIQDVTALCAAGGLAHDILIFLPWNQRLLSDAQLSASARVAEELAFWQTAWELARKCGVSRIIQIGYDWTGPGAFGQHLSGHDGGDIALVRRLNEGIREALPRGAYFVDLEQVSGNIGRDQFYDPRQYYWTKQPFSHVGLAELARAVFAGVRALTAGSKKVLVLDLDNTLWGGVVGEVGPQDIRLGYDADGEAFVAFQRHLKALAARGVLLAVASKNNPADAREPFETRSEMMLSLHDFSAFEAGWDPKAEMLARIAASLRLGVDSFVFFDDNPAEREHIRQALPDVEVVDVPADPAEYIRVLERGGWFESLELTAEDRLRSEQYAAERVRAESSARAASLEEYLSSLQMRALVHSLADPDLPRVVQLIGKTNQFNLTTRRHSEEQVRRMLTRADNVCITVRMADRYGDAGLVACVLTVPEHSADVPSLRIDTWLMSCRVIGRTLEHLTLREVACRAAALGYRRLIGEYVASAKNQIVATLYEELGFEPQALGSEERRLYELNLPAPNLPATFVTRVTT